MTDFSDTRYNTIFKTPLVRDIWEEGVELNPILRDRILAHEANSPGIVKSNYGGWHSETGQLEFCGDVGERLLSRVLAFTDEATRRFFAQHNKPSPTFSWKLTAWANVSRNGDFNSAHVHPGSTWSGTYYVDTGDPTDPQRGTLLHLLDPIMAARTTFLSVGESSVPANFVINPTPGLMILFPSYLPHEVYPHKGDAPRISIAFNLKKEPYP
jgi:uncharacterized protein (TIGR02466 family)